jgi:capsular exopolysaccharide synthesis family protein
MNDFNDQPHNSDNPSKRAAGELVPKGTATQLTPQNAWNPPAPMWLDPNSGNEGVNVMGFVHSLRRRWLPGVLVGSILATIVAALMWLLIPTSFEAVGLIKVKRSVRQVMSEFYARESPDEYSVFKQTQPAMIKSHLVLNEAVRKLQPQALPMLQDEDSPVAWLDKELEVAYLQNSEILRVAIRGEDTSQPTEIVKAVMNSYIDMVANDDLRTTQERVRVLSEKKADVSTQIRRTMDDIISLAERLGSDDNFQARVNNEIEFAKLSRIDRSREELKRELQSIANQIYLTQVHMASASGEINPIDLETYLEMDPEYAQYRLAVKQIREQLQEANASGNVQGGAASQQLQELLAKYNQRLKNRRKEIEPRIVRQHQQRRGHDEELEKGNLVLLNADLQAKLQLLERKDAEYQDQLQKVNTLSIASSELEFNKFELAALSSAHKEIEEQLERARVNQAGDEKRIEVIQPAVVPDASNFRIKLLGIAASWLGTLGLTVVAIAVWDYIEKHLNTTDEIERGLRLKVLGTLPSLRGGGVRRIFGGPLTEGAITDSMDSIRAAIHYGNKGQQINSLIVTSAAEREGKTMVASQLAVSMARAGLRTLLIDGDLRNPSQHTVFGLPPERGLSEVLRGDVQLEEVIQSTPAESLWILPAGQCDSASLQALAGPGTGSIIEWCVGQFDRVIIDCGPVLVGAEAMIYGQHVDGAVLATRRDVSRMNKIEEASRRLTSVGVQVVGVVVNGCESETRRNQIALLPN